MPVTLSCLSPKVSQHVPLSVTPCVAPCVAPCMCCCVRAVRDVPHTKYMGKGYQLSFRHAVTLGFDTLHPFYTHMGAQMPPIVTPCAPRVSAHAQSALVDFGDFSKLYAPAIQAKVHRALPVKVLLIFLHVKLRLFPHLP